MPPLPEPNPALRLANPSINRETRSLTIHIPKEDYEYLFIHVLAGSRAIQAVGGNLFKSLVEHLKASGLPAVYDPDNESIIARILTRTNFDELAPASGAPPRRRADRSAPVAPRKSASGDRKRRGAKGSSPEV